jgi:hypothetical protein
LDTYDRKWKNGFAALSKFKAREGHCRVPKGHIEGAYKLSHWVRNQRHSRDTLTAKRRNPLDAIGFFWDWNENVWENGFTALIKFKAREGHCLVPRYYLKDGYKLGQWVSVQRLNWSRLSAVRRRRLNAIGFVWDWREHRWEQGFIVLTKFKARERHCLVPASHIERKFKLGQWVTVQRRTKDKMSAMRKAQLNKIGFVWRAR